MTGNRSAIQPMLDSTPMSGCSRNSHIRLATATDVAIVDVKMKRKTARPRRYLSASTARPTPSTSPVGTVSRANFTVTQSASTNSLLRATSTYWSQPLDTQFSPWRVAAHVPEPDRLDERVDDEDRRGSPPTGRASAARPAGRASVVPRLIGHDPTVGHDPPRAAVPRRPRPSARRRVHRAGRPTNSDGPDAPAPTSLGRRGSRAP